MSRIFRGNNSDGEAWYGLLLSLLLISAVVTMMVMRSSRPSKRALKRMANSPPPPPPSPPPPPPFDYYVIAQIWFPTFVLSNPPSFNSKLLPRFYLHGLWASKYDRQHPRNVAIDNMDFDYGFNALSARLNNKWKNIYTGDPTEQMFAWNVQWRRHGGATGLKQSQYLALSLNIFEDKQILEVLAEAEIVPQDHVTYATSSVISAISNAIAVPILVCVVIDGEYYLEEVRLCLTLDVNQNPVYENCQHRRPTCGAKLHFPLGPFTKDDLK